MYLLKIGWRSWCWRTRPVLIMKTRTRDTVYRFVSGSNLHQVSLKFVTEFLRNRAHLKAKTWGWKHDFIDGVNNAIIIIIHYNNNITESTPLNTVSTKRPYSFQDCWLHYIVHGLYFYCRVYQSEVTQNFQFIDRTCSQHSWSFTHNDKKIVFITDEVIQQKGLSESYYLSICGCCFGFVSDQLKSVYLYLCFSTFIYSLLFPGADNVAQQLEVLAGQSLAEGQTLPSLSPHEQRQRWRNVRRRRVLSMLHPLRLSSRVTWPVLFHFL